MQTVPFSFRPVSGSFAAHPTLLQREYDELLGSGVTGAALDSPSPLRAGRIVWTGSNRFAFEKHEPLGVIGKRAFLFVVTDGGGDPVDIVAWQPMLDRIGTWRGVAWALGQDAIYAPRLTEHDGLPVWRSPLDWLRARRRGIVLIEPRLAAEWLCDAGPLVAEDFDHARELSRVLSRPAPRILFPADTGRAAA